MIRFELPHTLPVLNTLLREGRWRRKARRDKLAWEVLAALGRQRPSKPFVTAHIRVERHGLRAVDPDGLDSSAKALLDILQPPSATHPAGLGIITNDSRNRLSLDVVEVLVRKRADQKTVVIIEEGMH